jgi:micrococcal nuclease
MALMMNRLMVCLALLVALAGCRLPATGSGTTVTRVIDGDTIEVSISGVVEKVRYIGIDTPEIGKPFFKESTEANRRMVDGKTVTLVKDVSERDRYGRLLRYVYVGELFVNAELLHQGYAQVATYPPDVEYVNFFLQLQREAREAGRGLWGLPSIT